MAHTRVPFSQPRGSWQDVRRQLETLEPKTEVFVPHGLLPHPRHAGAVLSVGLPVGQRSDWRFAAALDCTGLHVHELATGWAAHLDQVHPSCGLVPHLQADAPGVLLAVGLVAGGGVGLATGRPLLGVLLGLVLGAAMASGGQLPVVHRLQAAVRGQG